MMDPVMDAFTRSKSPARSATIAMISSAALPNVALRRPPTPSPTRSEMSSVAWPIRPASGMIPRQATAKIHMAGEWNTHSMSMATGTNTSSRFSQLPPEMPPLATPTLRCESFFEAPVRRGHTLPRVRRPRNESHGLSAVACER